MCKMCKSCPFNYTEESEYAQNTGCLPNRIEILKLKDETNNNWACHSNNKRICGGLSEERNTINGALYLSPGENADSNINLDISVRYKPILLPNPTK